MAYLSLSTLASKQYHSYDRMRIAKLQVKISNDPSVYSQHHRKIVYLSKDTALNRS
jgi:hypothetical protein